LRAADLRGTLFLPLALRPGAAAHLPSHRSAPCAADTTCRSSCGPARGLPDQRWRSPCSLLTVRWRSDGCPRRSLDQNGSRTESVATLAPLFPLSVLLSSGGGGARAPAAGAPPARCRRRPHPFCGVAEIPTPFSLCSLACPAPVASATSPQRRSRPTALPPVTALRRRPRTFLSFPFSFLCNRRKPEHPCPTSASSRGLLLTATAPRDREDGGLEARPLPPNGFALSAVAEASHSTALVLLLRCP
jgi:hypothetical protein